MSGIKHTTTSALIEVLKGAEGPMKVAAIAADVVPMVPGLKGATPAATVAAKLYTEATKPDGLFEKVEGGFVLRQSAVDALLAKAQASKASARKPAARKPATGRKNARKRASAAA